MKSAKKNKSQKNNSASLPQLPHRAQNNLPEAFLRSHELYPFDFKENANWRIFRILSEFVEGFEFLSGLNKEVTFFGSSRLSSTNKHYKEALQLARMLASSGYTIITGGGPGIMEAANKGAFLANGASIGLNIKLPREQRTNPYVKQSIDFHYFFIRKVMLSVSSQAYVFFPGGFGTLDEFFEVVTLVQTKKMEHIPIVLVGRDFWDPLIAWIVEVVLRKHDAINKEDMNIFTVVDSVQEAFALIKKTKERKYF